MLHHTPIPQHTTYHTTPHPYPTSHTHPTPNHTKPPHTHPTPNHTTPPPPPPHATTWAPLITGRDTMWAVNNGVGQLAPTLYTGLPYTLPNTMDTHNITPYILHFTTPYIITTPQHYTNHNTTHQCSRAYSPPHYTHHNTTPTTTPHPPQHHTSAVVPTHHNTTHQCSRAYSPQHHTPVQSCILTTTPHTSAVVPTHHHSSSRLIHRLPLPTAQSCLGN